MAAKKKAAKKSAAKRSSAKRTVKKSAKRTTTKRKVKKSAKKSSRSTVRYSIPSVPVSGSSRSSLSSISTTPKPSSGVSYKPKSTSSDSSSSKGIVIAVVVGILILAVAVISKNSNSDTATVTPTPAASESAEPTTEPSSAPIGAYEAPVGIVSLYNDGGATVNWKTPAAAEGITGYNVELRANGVGEWKLVATVPATQLKQQITKNDETGWVQVRVSTVYSDGEVVAGKVHGLPGSWS
ncbi:Fibronectin domain-containing protein [Candidatus Nanopelagicus hibericus]|uniref:Fibronectin domain-containing protein n=1 Tax=Candidatus Nanopelagicus hibericus TaxID=1884915 RepID=A0A249KA38_9ACTN|nr:hypothetical protein [Candidatus Nanopelagicus hibericus]ASY13658.1 Fibronectin domain-containing protein [Candidatus Nanopelagicus hibericus]